MCVCEDAVTTYPSSSLTPKDWNKIEREVLEEEKSEKPEGDAALNKLFQQIYADGSDETKKAMMKSFVSGRLLCCRLHNGSRRICVTVT